MSLASEARSGKTALMMTADSDELPRPVILEQLLMKGEVPRLAAEYGDTGV